MTTDQMTHLTDAEYEIALVELADYEKRITEATGLEQRDSLRVAATLDRLYHDPRWIEERNLERAMTAKSPRGGRPVDPSSRSQFSTWVRGRFPRYDPAKVYRLLDAQHITQSFLVNYEKTPTAEFQVRPLKSLMSVANGSGSRIPAVWELACQLASEEGRNQPTKDDVRRAIAEWRRINIPAAQARRERAEDSAWVKERKAEAAWKELVRVGGSDQINKFLDVVEADVAQLQAKAEQP